MSSRSMTARSWFPTRHRSPALRDELHALVGLGAVADQVAEAPDAVDALSSIAASTASSAGRFPWMSRDHESIGCGRAEAIVGVQ